MLRLTATLLTGRDVEEGECKQLVIQEQTFINKKYYLSFIHDPVRFFVVGFQPYPIKQLSYEKKM